MTTSKEAEFDYSECDEFCSEHFGPQDSDVEDMFRVIWDNRTEHYTKSLATISDLLRSLAAENAELKSKMGHVDTMYFNLLAERDALQRQLRDAQEDARGARACHAQDAKSLVWWRDQFSSMNGVETQKVADRLAELQRQIEELKP